MPGVLMAHSSLASGRGNADPDAGPEYRGIDGRGSVKMGDGSVKGGWEGEEGGLLQMESAEEVAAWVREVRHAPDDDLSPSPAAFAMPMNRHLVEAICVRALWPGRRRPRLPLDGDPLAMVHIHERLSQYVDSLALCDMQACFRCPRTLTHPDRPDMQALMCVTPAAVARC